MVVFHLNVNSWNVQTWCCWRWYNTTSTLNRPSWYAINYNCCCFALVWFRLDCVVIFLIVFYHVNQYCLLWYLLYIMYCILWLYCTNCIVHFAHQLVLLTICYIASNDNRSIWFFIGSAKPLQSICSFFPFNWILNNLNTK